MSNTTFNKRQRTNSAPVKYRYSGSQNNNRNSSRPGLKASTLDPSRLVKEASQTEVRDFRSDRLIKDLPISVQLKQSLEKKGFERPVV